MPSPPASSKGESDIENTAELPSLQPTANPGSGDRRPSATDTWIAPPLAGASFVARWSSKPLSELFDYMRTAMPLNSPGGLSSQQNADLLAFILKKSGYEAGTMALPDSSEKLTGLRISAR